MQADRRSFLFPSIIHLLSASTADAATTTSLPPTPLLLLLLLLLLLPTNTTFDFLQPVITHNPYIPGSSSDYSLSWFYVPTRSSLPPPKVGPSKRSVAFVGRSQSQSARFFSTLSFCFPLPRFGPNLITYLLYTLLTYIRQYHQQHQIKHNPQQGLSLSLTSSPYLYPYGTVYPYLLT